MNAWKIVCATLVIFLAGLITGAALMRVAGARPGSRWIQRPGGDPRLQPGAHRPATQFNANPAIPPVQPLPPSTSGPAPGLLSREFIQLLERRLELTPEQREQIGQIMRDGQERIRVLRSTIDPQLRKELQQTRESIRAVLTPGQREQFEQMMKRGSRRSERGDQPGLSPERRFRDQREPRDLQSAPPPANP